MVVSECMLWWCVCASCGGVCVHAVVVCVHAVVVCECMLWW